MAESTVKLTGEEAKGVAALRRVAKKIPARARSVHVHLEEAAAGVEPGEVLVVVLSAAGALVGRPSVHGRAPDVKALRTLLMGADVAAERLTARAPLPPPPLASGEAELLDEAGLVEKPEGAYPLERAGIELELLLRESLSLDQAARELKVSTGRLRQRLSPDVRTLYGVKVGGRAWRIPRFQFARKGRLVRNLNKVLPRFSAEAHPLSVYTWLTSPHQDLVVGKDEKSVTPIAWLEAGLEPEVVAKLATEV
ncbi:MAG TPA: hypothetical protein VK524_19195 [Polyangiaceae bacterium]|nr:hypothetical protein [Polyangiaceae bacterium]